MEYPHSIRCAADVAIWSGQSLIPACARNLLRNPPLVPRICSIYIVRGILEFHDSVCCFAHGASHQSVKLSLVTTTDMSHQTIRAIL